MKHKPIMIGLAVLAILLLARAHFKLSKADRKAPDISYTDNKLVYTDGEDYKNLLVGVSAIDKKDGDVSSSLVVEKIYKDEVEKQVVVTYAAVDKSNNLAKLNRVLEYNPIDEGKAKNTNEPEPTMNALQTPEPTKGSAMVIGEAPVLYLKTQTVTINANDKFTLNAFIAHAVDDKDSEDTLIKNVKEQGAYKTDVRGEYEMSISVVDSEGNESNVEKVKLVVQ